MIVKSHTHLLALQHKIVIAASAPASGQVEDEATSYYTVPSIKLKETYYSHSFKI